MVLFTLIGFAVAFNILIVIWKLTNDRVFDGIIDGALLCLVAMVFSGTQGALVIGAIGSMVVSIYLLIRPLRLGDV